LLEYDDVANDQRKVIYEQRNELLVTEDISDVVVAMRSDVVHEILIQYIPPGSLDETWDIQGAGNALQQEFGQQIDLQQWLDTDDDMGEDQLRTKVTSYLEQVHEEKEQLAGSDSVRFFEKHVMLNRLDYHWKEHLANMDYLRQSVGLRGYAQKNPKQEYKRESFEMFGTLLEEIKHDVIGILSKVEVRDPEQVDRAAQRERQAREASSMEYQHAQAENPLNASPGADLAEAQRPQSPYVREAPKLGRNEPCWCDSGKKYKHCHGKLT
jgi:preprotein translocase subunit SecA